MKNNKAIFIIPNLQGNGAERFVLSIYNGLSKLKGVECHIICFEECIEYNLPEDINLHIVSPPKIKGFRSFIKRKLQAKFIENYIIAEIGIPDIILSNLTSADKLTKYFTLPKVYHVIHSTTSIEHLKSRIGFKRFLAKKKIESIYSKHDRICVSEGAAEDLNNNFTLPGINHVIYNPVNVEEIRILSQSTISQFENMKYFVHIGKFNDAKRHDRLIKAYKLANVDEHLILLGKGPKEQQARKLVNELGLSDKVIFAGHQQNPYPTLTASQGLILSSDYEGLPTVILEALSVGVPVISTDCNSGPREILPKSSLSRLNPNSLAKKISELSRETEKFKCKLDDKFRIETVVKEYYKLLK
ncbi:glycosyltransferase [Aliivibrio finisterrensis]|uniref:Glycosyltransferase n=1 Tax=Aliivibrio finisterrensis TaxID=511998 RepID=A0A6N6RPZ0_9GAMM|nr:glycosyltransferase [Aliivibrio finisterrensis]KAB2823519.1 glycosyltransferase [Aliivibrio finisterrensis]